MEVEAAQEATDKEKAPEVSQEVTEEKPEQSEPNGRLQKARKDAAKYRTQNRELRDEMKSLRDEVEELKSGKKVSEQERALKEAQKRIEAAEAKVELTASVAGIATTEHVPLEWAMDHIETLGLDGSDLKEIREAVQDAANEFRDTMEPYVKAWGYVKGEEATASTEATEATQQTTEQEQSQEQVVQGKPSLSTMDTSGFATDQGKQAALISQLEAAYEAAEKAKSGSNKDLSNAMANFQKVKREIMADPDGPLACTEFARRVGSTS